MRVSDGDHDGEDVVPSLGVAHDGVGEHATVPTDMTERFREIPFVVAEPETGVARDVELAVGIVGETMPAGMIVRAGAEHGRVVLRDVEVDRPRPERVR